MNENWNPPRPTALVSVLQNQQQQPATVADSQNHPHHPRTTPDWSTQNIVIASEVMEDKNNDSGVSPGHYETSPSPERRSSENRSYTPCSNTSSESQPGPSTSYAFTSQEGYQNDSVPMDYATEQSEPNANVEEQMDVVSNSMRTRRDKPLSRAHRFLFECPLCQFQSYDRSAFWKHLTVHYNPNRLVDEPPVPTTVPIPGCTPEEIAERITRHEESINYPIINAQGKVKINRCKICKFRAITKVEYWRHIKIHTRVEKRLYCQYCPFVTDLKHHFEYHMNKQTGAKPFSCKQCSYKCVNKSMLSSHMKSHTDVRQFSCSNCGYVTKYCHSLKMHLRKYHHEPGPILHPDGSLNLFTTIDVYGTRRGPKQKKTPTVKVCKQVSAVAPRQVSKARNSIASSSNSSTSAEVSSPSSSPIENQPLLINPMTMTNPFSGTGLNSMLAVQYNQLLRNGFPAAEPYANNDEMAQRNLNQVRANIIAEFMMAAERIQVEMNSNANNEMYNYYNTQGYADVPQPVADINAQYVDAQMYNLPNSLEVLDLSRHSNADSITSNVHNNNSITINNNTNTNSNNNNNCDAENLSMCTVIREEDNYCMPSSSSTSKGSGTSRRKGRAIKLSRRSMENDSDDDNHSEDNVAERGTPESSASSEHSHDVNSNAARTSKDTISLKCNFCPISFGSEAMYAIHMGYHGFKDPYTCNICGQRCDDALSFNVHLSRSSHA